MLRTLGLMDVGFTGGQPTEPMVVNFGPYGNWAGNYSDVSLLLRGGSPIFVPFDESPTPKTITTVGNAGISTTTFKYGGSCLVAGTSPNFTWGSNRIQVPAGPAFAYGTGDFTVEAWIYQTVASTGIFWNQATSGTNYFVCTISSGGIPAFTGTSSGGGSPIFGPAIPLNTWGHVAIVRRSGNVTVYSNGTGGSAVANSTNFSDTTLIPTIGSYTHSAGSLVFSGLIDDLRVTKGVARYETGTGANAGKMVFTGTNSLALPTTELPANVTDDPSYNSVSLLLRGGGVPALALVDESPTPKTVVAQAPAVLTTTTFKYGGSALSNPYSGYYSVTGSETDAAFDFGSGDFTVEGWVYLLSNQLATLAAKRLAQVGHGWAAVTTDFSGHIGGAWRQSVITASNPLTNTWFHYALTRSGNDFRMFHDGTQVGATYTQSGALQNVGVPLRVGVAGGTGEVLSDAIFDDLRITKGIARYTANFTPPTAELPANVTNDPSYNSVSLLLRGGVPALSPIDESLTPKTITSVGNAGISTAVFKYGTSALAFDGSGDYFEITDTNNDFDLGGSNATLELWAYPMTASGFDVIIAKGGNTANFNTSDGFEYQLQYDKSVNRFVFYFNNGAGPAGASGISGGTQTTGSWYHLAIVTNTSNNIAFYINGVNVASATSSIAKPATRTRFRLGTDLSGNDFTGYIDDLRITKGIARYTANFTPPPAQLPPAPLVPPAPPAPPAPPVGQEEFITPGTYSWIAPVGVTLVSVVCVGGGGAGGSGSGSGGSGGGGGGLGWRNNIAVTPGQSYTVVVGSAGARAAGVGGNGGDSYFISTGTVAGFGGNGAPSILAGGSGGGFVGDGGGSGGNSTNSTTASASGGGGAGGYTGDGGSANLNTNGSEGSGGGGGAGGHGGSSDAAGAGGGVGILGQGANGSGGTLTGGNGTPGSGGSGGESGSASPGSSSQPSTGGNYGGGGGGAEILNEHGPGGSGAVRIIWGGGRSYPSNAANA